MPAPGFLTKRVHGIEREKQNRIKQLLTEMRAAGIQNPSQFFFGSNQQSNGKRKKQIGRRSGDEDYEPFNGEERLIDDDGNDESSRSKVKKMKSTTVGNKNGGFISHEEGSSPHETTKALQLPISSTEQTDPRKSNGKRKKQIERGYGDEYYEPINGEEGLSDDDGNDEFLRSKAKKVKSTSVGNRNGGSTSQEEDNNPHEATQALQLPISSNEQTDPFCSPHMVADNVVHEARTTMSKKPTRKRGPTKLKTIAIDGVSRIKVLFNENGIPIGDGSIKLSSFYGALVRELVPYTLSDWRKLPSGLAEVLWRSIQVRFELDEDWQRQLVFQRMNVAWRASKSILVHQVINASNEKERLQLQPSNVKSLHDWKDFVKEKTSANFKKDKNKSTSRVAVWAEGHRRKIGRPVNENVQDKIAQMEKIEREIPKSSLADLKQDALCKVLGPERHGRLKTFGKGVTLTKLVVLSQMNGYIAQMHEETVQYKSQVAHMQNTIDELKQSNAHIAATTKETTTTCFVSPSGFANPDSSCKLLDWMGTGVVVAEGRWSSSDPKKRVHHIPLGPNAMRVWVDIAKNGSVFFVEAYE